MEPLLPGVTPPVPAPPRKVFIALAVFGLLGVIFSAFSTYDFVAHLDRQVHAITCSIVPGIGARDTSGTSGCHSVLMSPYSSILRDMTWGGVPISLLSLGVFAFLLFRGVDMVLRPIAPKRETGFLILAGALPVVTSLIYMIISMTKIGSMCKLCIGIYVSSLGVFVSAIVAHVMNQATDRPSRETAAGLWAFYFVEGVAMVALPLLLYIVLKPAYPDKLLQTSGLRHPEDKYNVMFNLRGTGPVPAIEVLDPLCNACKGFSARLSSSGLEERLSIKAVLFPLDKECNWMVGESMHPGACAVSEAVLCAGDRGAEVVSYAFANQTELLELGRKGGTGLRDRLGREFPGIVACLGQPMVKNRINKSLRWIVGNSLPVLTPQLFVRNQKLPDEDTDLGLDFVLTKVLARAQEGSR